MNGLEYHVRTDRHVAPLRLTPMERPNESRARDDARTAEPVDTDPSGGIQMHTVNSGGTRSESLEPRLERNRWLRSHRDQR